MTLIVYPIGGKKQASWKTKWFLNFGLIKTLVNPIKEILPDKENKHLEKETSNNSKEPIEPNEISMYHIS